MKTGKFVQRFCFFILGIAAAAGSAYAGTVITVPSDDAPTITEAMLIAQPGDTVRVASGVYRENVVVAAGAVLQAANRREAIIQGDKRGPAVKLSSQSRIDGFIVREAKIGVFSFGDGNAVTNCSVVDNWETGIMCIGHLPEIRDNIIAFNRGSGVQGWNVRSTAATINHNTIAYNGNTGVAIGGESQITIENSIVAFNERYGIKVSGSADAVKVVRNNIFANENGIGVTLTDCITEHPRFANPRKELDFTIGNADAVAGKATDGSDIGARL